MIESNATFRRATNQDAPLAQALVDAALREYGLGIVLQDLDIDLVDLELHYDARGGRFEILEGPDGEALGVVGWRLTDDGICELKKLYLARAARGRGLGRLALERVVASALALGCSAIVLETAAALERANRLYLRFGFVPVSGAAAASFETLSEQCNLAYRLDLSPNALDRAATSISSEHDRIVDGAELR